MTARKPTLEQRVALVERDVRSHAESLTAYNGKLQEHGDRLLAIEEARRARQLEEVRREEREEARDIALKLRLTHIDLAIGTVQADVKSIRGAGMKLAWIVITLVAGIIIAFAFKGGFTI